MASGWSDARAPKTTSRETRSEHIAAAAIITGDEVPEARTAVSSRPR